VKKETLRMVELQQICDKTQGERICTLRYTFSFIMAKKKFSILFAVIFVFGIVVFSICFIESNMQRLKFCTSRLLLVPYV